MQAVGHSIHRTVYVYTINLIWQVPDSIPPEAETSMLIWSWVKNHDNLNKYLSLKGKKLLTITILFNPLPSKLKKARVNIPNTLKLEPRIMPPA